MDYLISNKLVENSSSSLAKFLRTTHGLDKTMIGDYLDQHEEFLLGVMQSYIDFMKCFGMKFASAIHEFLKGFRLPGEAQKIDRIMKKVDEAARGGAVVEGGHGGEGGRSRLGTEGDAEPVQDPYREKS